MRRWFAVLALSVFALGASAARADEQSDLEKAKAAYLGHRLDEAEERFRALLAAGMKDGVFKNQARAYFGATLIAKKRNADAVEQFEALILDDPTFEPDPLVFPTEVHDLFIDTRKRLTDRINAAKQEAARLETERRAKEEADRRRQAEYLENLKRLASEEKITVRHSRWVALLPLGVGQFQNGDHLLGWVFLGVEVALTGAAVAMVPFNVYNLQEADRQNSRGDRFKALEYDDRAEGFRAANWLLLGGAGFVAAAGVIQAQLAFTPDHVETRRRPLQPAASVVPGGAAVGVRGRF